MSAVRKHPTAVVVPTAKGISTVGRWRIAAVVGCLGVVLAASASPTAAARWVRIALDPPGPTAGASARVSVTSFYLSENLCWDDPRAMPHPFPHEVRLFAFRPDWSDLREIPLAARVNADRRWDGAVWDGVVVFPSAGRWVLRIAPPGPAAAGQECAGGQIAVEVLPRTLPRGGAWPGLDPGVAVLGAIAAATGAAVLAVGRRR